MGSLPGAARTISGPRCSRFPHALRDSAKSAQICVIQHSEKPTVFATNRIHFSGKVHRCASSSTMGHQRFLSHVLRRFLTHVAHTFWKTRAATSDLCYGRSTIWRVEPPVGEREKRKKRRRRKEKKEKFLSRLATFASRTRPKTAGSCHVQRTLFLPAIRPRATGSFHARRTLFCPAIQPKTSSFGYV